MKKKHLTFSMALDLLIDWSPVFYTNLITRTCVFEVPMLAYVDIMKLFVYDNWFLAGSAEFDRSLQVILETPYNE